MNNVEINREVRQLNPSDILRMKCGENIDELEYGNGERMMQESRDFTHVIDDMDKVETFKVQTVFEINK